ncbi:MAG: cytochrome c [Fulvivirga sp.]|nr:cytochrome c [Fulvivirga sp.]
MIRLVIIFFLITTLLACTGKSKQENLSHSDAVKLEQYLVEGEKLYTTYCANCHQANGEGLANLFPPLKDSDYMEENFEKVLCSMKYGLQGEIVVNGKTYNQAMPGIPTLTPLEIAEIATYIYNTWGDKRGIIPVKNVENKLKNCKK